MATCRHGRDKNHLHDPMADRLDADRLTIELLVAGLVALAVHANREL